MGVITFSVTDATSAEALWAMSQYFEELNRRFAEGFAAGATLDEAVVMFKPPVGLVVVASNGDTNASLVEAIAMYQSCGYRSTGRSNDNPYADLWFEKQIDQGCHPEEPSGH